MHHDGIATSVIQLAESSKSWAPFSLPRVSSNEPFTAVGRAASARMKPITDGERCRSRSPHRELPVRLRATAMTSLRPCIGSAPRCCLPGQRAGRMLIGVML